MPTITLALAAGPGNAASNSNTFRLALTASNDRIHIPEGLWYFEEIMFNGNEWLPANLEIFGDGREHTVLRYVPTVDTIPFFFFAPEFGPNPPSRTILRDLQIIGRVSPGIGVPAVGTGVRMYRSHLNIVREVEIWNFELGIELGKTLVMGDPGLFTGYTAIENFEISGCETGIRLFNASNGVLLKSGRILGAATLIGSLSDPKDPNSPPTALPITLERGIGIHIEGTNSVAGPEGGSAVVISQVTVENSPICLKIANSHDIVVEGCYFEPDAARDPVTFEIVGNPNKYARKVTEIDTISERIALIGTVQSEPDLFAVNDPVKTEDWTPLYAERAPEARGVIDLDTYHGTGASFTSNVYGASYNGATAAHVNHIRNGDFSRGMKFWTLSTGAILVVTEQIGTTDCVIGGSSLMLGSSTQKTDHIAYEFVVDDGVRAITAMIRYRLATPAPAAFRVEICTVNGALVTPIGFYSDSDASGTDWRLRALTARFDGTLNGVKGPRKFQIRLYPFNVDGAAVSGKRVVIDSVWVVDGEYAAPYRPYQEGIEVLSGAERLVLFSGTSAIVGAGPSGIPATVRVPPNAVGMITEMSIMGVNASGSLTTLRVDDNTGGGAADVRDLVAMVSNRATLIEYTVPLLGSGTGPQWTMLGALAANAVTYSVRLKAWIYRL